MGDILTYKDEIVKAMDYLSKDERTIFIGQLVNCWGSIYGTLENIPKDKKIELPIMEDTQMGMSIGMALEGYVPITIYPRMDFLILAMNQLINHLDMIETMSNEEFKPKIIIRTIIGSKEPLYPGEQHCQDHTELFKLCLKNVNVIKLEDKNEVMDAYKNALNNDKSTLIIEDRGLY